jgi:chromosome segregation ATPase
MAKGSSKSAAAIERLLEERRQYEAWLARIKATADSVSDDVRTRVKADYEARLKAVMEELTSHADAARQLVAQRKETLRELQKKEKAAAERLAETELRHEVGEYDEAQWAQVHKDALADLGAVRDELMGIERDITRLVELDTLVKAKPTPASRTAAGELTLTPSPPPKSEKRKTPIDELAFLKSVTEDDRTPSPRRASGEQFQIDDNAALEMPENEDAPVEKTLKCKECGTMNVATEWYCEKCGGELAAM